MATGILPDSYSQTGIAEIDVGNASSSVTKTVSFSGASFGLIFVTGHANARIGLYYFCYTPGNENVVFPILQATGLTITPSTDVLTFTGSSSSNCIIRLLILSDPDYITVTSTNVS